MRTLDILKVFPSFLIISFPATATGSVLARSDTSSWQWGSLSPYADNSEDHFGVHNVGLPDGCQVEQVQLLQRHAQRFPEGKPDDQALVEGFRNNVTQYKSAGFRFIDRLEFLNNWTYGFDAEFLTGVGAETEFESGVNFWNRYGRLLYNAGPGALRFNGYEKIPPLVRTTDKSRVHDSQINWALGFFGPGFNQTPDGNVTDFRNLFRALVMTEDSGIKTPLAGHQSCSTSGKFKKSGGDYADAYISAFLQNATSLFQKMVPSAWKLTGMDVYAMQLMCAYDWAYIEESEFCKLFNATEWAAFGHRFDIEHYYASSFGNPTGRAQGIGYVQEMIARLEHEHINTSTTSVNASMDNNDVTFPLDQKFYADFSHDHVIIAVLTALSLDFFRSPPDTEPLHPLDANRNFNVSGLTPFGARLVTERIGCKLSNPPEVTTRRTFYSQNAYGYDATNATNKFVRMRLNNGILPLASIRGGKCLGRTDGMCPLQSFVGSQSDAVNQANFTVVCNTKAFNPPKTPDCDGRLNCTAPTSLPLPDQVVLEL